MKIRDESPYREYMYEKTDRSAEWILKDNELDGNNPDFLDPKHNSVYGIIQILKSLGMIPPGLDRESWGALEDQILYRYKKRHDDDR